jgi:hypothetical protein
MQTTKITGTIICQFSTRVIIAVTRTVAATATKAILAVFECVDGSFFNNSGTPKA